ncbi:MAG: FAD-dependent oxidoreductase [Acidimicrobiia bacterium]|nr:FAD-dependent oxidoreductase [Acidimicrobiia bacterium]MCY4435188.1 FAD-dependent oxidoreductase [bacterium]
MFQPLDIGGCTLPNRIVRTAHSTGAVGEDLIAYHEARAKGGAALTILQIAGVHPTSPTDIPVFTDRVLPFYEEMAARLHAAGGKVFQQLWHGGAAIEQRSLTNYQQPLAPSPIPSPMVGDVPQVLTTSMIDELVEAFAVAARRCEQGGLDGVELHGAHGYLIGQFLSPATNLRDDDYGGSLENRTRFLREILAAIRSETSPGFPVGLRISADDQIEGGVDPEEAAAIAKLVEPDLDFLDVSLSSYWRFHRLLSTLDEGLGYEVPTSEVVTTAVEVPTIVTGRITTLDHAEHLIQSGVADLVSIVRGMIADPELVAKARDGREGEIRPCIGTSVGCVARFMVAGKMRCVVNTAAGQETKVPFEPNDRVAEPKRVLVAGGGPAGLEAARTAALRGHEVVLYEMTGELGGQVRMAASAPPRSDVGAITAFLTDELDRLGVTVRLRSPVDPDVVAEERPDELIIATGTTPRRGFQISAPSKPIPGADLPHVYTSWEVLGFGGRASIGRKAVVYDDTGTFEAISVCDALMAAGAEVSFLSRHEQLGATILYPAATVEASRERLFSGPCSFTPAVALREITPEAVVTRDLGTYTERSFDADTVVIVSYHDCNNELANYLRAEMSDQSGAPPFNMHLVGDVNGTNSIMAAIHAGARVGRDI